MDDIDELIRNEMERFIENTTATSSGSSGHSVPPVQPFQPLPETVPQPERDREVAAPVDSTSQAYADVAIVSCQDSNEPTLKIFEEVVPNRRFRYDCEIKSAGAIQGVQSKKGQKSFPKIEIGNYEGPAEITVSLVCKDEPYRVHPNGIVGKNKSSEENFTYINVIKVPVTRNNCIFEFRDLGIRIVRPTQIEEALRLRETQKVDPFGQGFSHKFDPKTDDLQAVRLCFQVKLAREHQLKPVISDIIYHSKNPILGCLESLQIIEIIPSGTKVIIFSQRQQLNPKDVEVVFYKKENEWERCVKKFDISDTSGIVCAVPPYFRANIECDTEVTVFLRRLSDGICGAPRPFTYYADTDVINKKKRKMAAHRIQDFVMNNWTPPASFAPDNDSQYDQNWRKMPGPFDNNPSMPGPSSVNPAVPGPSFINPSVPGPSSFNATVLWLNHHNLAMPRPSYANPAVPGPSSVNQAMTGPSSVNAGELGSNHDKSTVPEPGFVISAVPGLNGVNPFLPEPTESTPMQINFSLSPDMVTTPFISQSMSSDMEPMPYIAPAPPMSDNEDEGFLGSTTNISITNDDEYLGEDSALLDIDIYVN